ncbi:MAG: hypothetical protein OEZ04_05240 [Nitrospinota bacterium]|nr:hypothetical protein [Nitrospinota bacterium]
MELKYCVNHPERPAIGECVITKKPICPECSTKYEGVNYSREGLAELKSRRALSAGAGFWSKVASLAMVAQAPVSLFLLYKYYMYIFTAILNLGGRSV